MVSGREGWEEEKKEKYRRKKADQRKGRKRSKKGTGERTEQKEDKGSGRNRREGRALALSLAQE